MIWYVPTDFGRCDWREESGHVCRKPCTHIRADNGRPAGAYCEQHAIMMQSAERVDELLGQDNEYLPSRESAQCKRELRNALMGAV